jgi:hypothetical protein
MRKLLKMLPLAACLTFMTAGPASAYYDYHEAAYFTTLYSDASHTTVVGHIWPNCGYYYVEYYLEGTYSIYSEDQLVGYCSAAGWDPV